MPSGQANNPLEAARAYLRMGYQPVPVPAGQKGPVLKGWNALRLRDEDLPRYFSGPGNIGLLLGEPSGGLIDVDLDCPEAIALADRFLPPTPAVTGRPRAPRSHRFYIADGVTTERHRDPRAGTVIVEIRGTGSQTLVGPSVHPSGEPYDTLKGEPARVSGEALTAAVAALAAAVIESRGGSPSSPAWPESPPLAACPPAADEALRRAEAYLDAIEPAISGAGGHNRTYAAATAMVHGFALDVETAFGLLRDRYNPRCRPPWSERELRHKVDDAAGRPHEKPAGWLRDADAAKSNGVDLSALTARRTPRPAEEVTEPPASADPGSFPPYLLAVPGLIERVVAYNLATAHRRQPVLALAGAVGLQAVLAARKVRDERGNRTNVYLVGVAPSGAGKDHARKVNKNILFGAGLGDHEGNEDLASDAGLVAAVAAEPAVLFQLDEFGRFLRTIGDPKKAPHLFNVLSALMRLYSSADTVFRGKAYADKNRNLTVDQPCVSVYGTTVPCHFYESLTAESLGDGFVARLLVFESDALPPRRRTASAPVPSDILDTARWWGDFSPGGNLRREHPEPVVVRTTRGAAAVFDTLAGVVDAESARDERGRSLWARAEEKACRLALVYACSADHLAPVVDFDAAVWACALTHYLTRRVLFVSGDWIADGAFDARQKRVLRIVRGVEGTISATELCRKTQWLTRRERSEVVSNLLETGQLREVTEATATKPRRVYVLA